MSEEHGLRYNEGKDRYDLLPPLALEQVAKLYTLGARKYTTLTIMFSEIPEWVVQQLHVSSVVIVEAIKQGVCVASATNKSGMQVDYSNTTLPASLVANQSAIQNQNYTLWECVGAVTRNSCEMEILNTKLSKTKIAPSGQRKIGAEKLGAIEIIEPETRKLLKEESDKGFCGPMGSQSNRTISFLSPKDIDVHAVQEILQSKLSILITIIKPDLSVEYFAIVATKELDSLEILSQEFKTRLLTSLNIMGITRSGERNWEKGFPWSETFGSLQRHLFAWFRGEDTDPETGLSHLSHAAFNVLCLLEFSIRKTGTDNRPYTKSADE